MHIDRGVWLAELIRAEQASLISTTVPLIRAEVPSYARLPDTALQTIFTQVYGVFARSLESDDMGPWRSYFQAALAARAQAGITPAEIIATIGLVQGRVLALAEQQLSNDPTSLAVVRSILRATANRIRMVVSELHLAELTNPSLPIDASGLKP